MYSWSGDAPRPASPPVLLTPDAIDDSNAARIAEEIVNAASEAWMRDGMSAAAAHEAGKACSILLPALMVCDLVEYESAIREAGGSLNGAGPALAEQLLEVTPAEDRPAEWTTWTDEQRVAWYWDRCADSGSQFAAVDVDSTRGWIGPTPSPGAVNSPLAGVLSMFDGAGQPARSPDEGSARDDFVWVELPVRFESGARGLVRLQLRRGTNERWMPRRIELLGSDRPHRLVL
ncbi:MAG: hypothetical protein IT439_07980 [Phycisphaerales bacterium]|nr:hypothetical protein [Phycisphaerales bacterium]